MKSIATDIYTFEDLLERDCVYVDKTNHIYSLLKNTGSRQFFLSRPRRFGKSLLLTTIQAIFEGKRELFDGLFINSTDYDWKTYPVIRLDMNTTLADTVDSTVEKVKDNLLAEIDRLNLRLELSDDPAITFKRMILAAANGSESGKVVILIDEYDKPLLNNLGSADVVPFQNFLKQFYGVVKSTEGYQRFCLMTGVSKFSKVSIFSDLNNLRDITMSPQFSTICGYTHEEVEHNFSEHIQVLAEEYGITQDEAFDKLCKMYDGYKFNSKCPQIFNPVSLGNCLTDLQFGMYWFETGTPGGLMNYLKSHPMDLSNYTISAEDLGTYDPENPGTVPLLFQTGYLTISDVEGELPLLDYVLDFPNLEVKAGYNSWLAKSYINKDNPDCNEANMLSRRALKALRAGDVDEFIDIIKQMFAAVPYELLDSANEHEYHALFHTMLYISASNIESEVQTNLGRIDSVVQTGDYVYVIEFKLDKTAPVAMEQIKDRDYYKKYQQQGKKLVLLGLNCSTKVRNINDYLYEII